MNTPYRPSPEFEELLNVLCDGVPSASQSRRLEELVAENEDDLWHYLCHVHLHGTLYWNIARPSRQADASWKNGPHAEDAAAVVQDRVEPLIPPIVLDLPSSSFSPISSFIGGPVFSYMAAAVILCVMLLSAWAYKISRYDRDSVVDNSRGQTAPGVFDKSPELVFVGRVARSADCRWSDPRTEAAVGTSVPVGRKFALAAGLLEITYDSGAVVILQGPCDYEVDARDGGFLALGKLTARIEKSGRVGEGEKGRLAGLNIHSPPLPLSPSPALFSVRTPTAVVTDLGTEFGVEVSEEGGTASYVFRGRIELRAVDGKRPAAASAEVAGRAIQLGEGESAQVGRVRETHQGTTAQEMVRFTHPATPPIFVRRMPHRGPIRVFNTGESVMRRGQPDPHWYITAGLNDPNFKPQPAVTTAVHSKFFRENRPGHAVWVSTDDMLPLLPEGTVYTFRTTFVLNGEPPKGLELRGGFAADNHVEAIRLNGRPAVVPEHGDRPPFKDLHPFSIADGFVEGTNVLEFDVANRQKEMSLRPSRMLLMVELEAAVDPAGGEPSASSGPSDQKQPSDGGKETER